MSIRKERQMTTTVHIDDELHTMLREIAEREDRSIDEVLDDAVRRYRRERFWEGVRDDLDRLKSDPVAWRSYRDEISLWESTSGDGLENEEPYYTPEEEAEIDAEYARTRRG